MTIPLGRLAMITLVLCITRHLKHLSYDSRARLVIISSPCAFQGTWSAKHSNTSLKLFAALLNLCLYPRARRKCNERSASKRYSDIAPAVSTGLFLGANVSVLRFGILRLSHADGAKGRKDNAIKRCQALTKLYTRSSEYHRTICYLMALSQ
jgi:hypothetical protein